VGGLTRERAAGCSRRFCQETRRGFLKGFSFSATAREGSCFCLAAPRKMDGAVLLFFLLFCVPRSSSVFLSLSFHPCCVIASLLISFQLLPQPPTRPPAHPLGTRLSESKLDRARFEKETAIVESVVSGVWGRGKRFCFLDGNSFTSKSEKGNCFWLWRWFRHCCVCFVFRAVYSHKELLNDERKKSKTLDVGKN